MAHCPNCSEKGYYSKVAEKKYFTDEKGVKYRLNIMVDKCPVCGYLSDTYEGQLFTYSFGFYLSCRKKRK